MWKRSELKERAKAALKLNYWKAVLVSLILAIISGNSGGSAGGTGSSQTGSSGNYGSSLSSIDVMAIVAFISAILVFALIIMAVSLLLSIFVFNPITVGAQRFLLSCDKNDPSFKDLVFAFSGSYGNIVKTTFLQALYIFLWSLLLIVPGIIKAYEYRMIPYILAEHPDMNTKEVFALSKEMMYGDKMNAFILDLSFIGWQILGMFTCCILSVFYVNPYYYLTCAELYKELKKKVNPSSVEQNSSYTEPMGNPYA